MVLMKYYTLTFSITDPSFASLAQHGPHPLDNRLAGLQVVSVSESVADLIDIFRLRAAVSSQWMQSRDSELLANRE
jgi:hypothetical protein